MFQSTGALALPNPLQRRMDSMAHAFLQPAAGPVVDFAGPRGENALIAAESVSWRVFKNPVSLFIGGIAAVLLELAEPRVRDGVWQHSNFRTDALARLQRTGLAAMVTVYGPRSKAETMIARVVSAHGRVTGHTSGGIAYDANDPELLDWVQATASYGFMEAYHGFVRPLNLADRNAMLEEGYAAARLYGAIGAPRSQVALDTLFAGMERKLVGSPIIAEFLDIMAHVPAFPAVARPMQRMLIRAAIDILPGWLRERLDLGADWSLKPGERALVRAVARSSERLMLRESPAIQSCRRLGLPDDYLYRPH
ncbi:oxygenase MpaB family protein [Sphingobium boeckii]|uniref:Uncharacterized protein (DUF2236 family) n=1 Tax=Sphingobium boeckii TaxID=1082345 RepID=A0A7W9EGG0_9SPHN|nr:oxygenase MpaB family protein [Sphingobium boeckii]MBB5687080.1 uncharacterized protein (DUF2236 family) [Sphingobium boeckii]